MKTQRSILWASVVAGVLGVSACTTTTADKPAATASDAASVNKKDDSTMKATGNGPKPASEEKEKVTSFD